MVRFYDKCFSLNNDKILQIYFFFLKRQAIKDLLKDVESTVGSNVV